ncbi:hypothetical protein P691DRAFT_785703 [Macrolepiota fuliginosa MF-IS2]|uniref:Uncharacterized protein n=1 Tax=Macrolepiota fuliginosa MF-IS2 TaxID=1400762 RepID=A0A9P5X5X1_9AGAR|nr:hypothetical protein P691DRAFT_785703 [Macrolepiota fuliginosa MF-IS2]
MAYTTWLTLMGVLVLFPLGWEMVQLSIGADASVLSPSQSPIRVLDIGEAHYAGKPQNYWRIPKALFIELLRATFMQSAAFATHVVFTGKAPFIEVPRDITVYVKAMNSERPSRPACGWCQTEQNVPVEDFVPVREPLATVFGYMMKQIVVGAVFDARIINKIVCPIYNDAFE